MSNKEFSEKFNEKFNKMKEEHESFVKDTEKLKSEFPEFGQPSTQPVTTQPQPSVSNPIEGESAGKALNNYSDFIEQTTDAFVDAMEFLSNLF